MVDNARLRVNGDEVVNPLPSSHETVLGFVSTGTERTIIAKANAGIPKYENGAINYDGTPALMADYVTMARDAGARVIGGCCGTKPVHLRAMREALDTCPRGERPTLDEIASTLGSFSSASDGKEDGADKARASRRRRRRA